jgi:hypothetical protein
MQVKGTWIVNYVKIIRADRDKKWDRYLAPEDWEIVNQRVLSSQWYSYESFQRIGLAVFKESAGSNLDTVRAFGRLMLDDLVKVYKTILKEGDPHASVQKFVALRETFFKDVEGYTRVIDQGSDWLDYKLMMVERDLKTEVAEAFATQMAGSLEALVERTGAKNVSADVKRIEDGFMIHLKWE